MRVKVQLVIWVVYLCGADKYDRPLASCLRHVKQPVRSPPIGVPGPDSARFVSFRAY
jgi:hypothetical protein